MKQDINLKETNRLTWEDEVCTDRHDAKFAIS